jgi:hypothetical protein
LTILKQIFFIILRTNIFNGEFSVDPRYGALKILDEKEWKRELYAKFNPDYIWNHYRQIFHNMTNEIVEEGGGEKVYDIDDDKYAEEIEEIQDDLSNLFPILRHSNGEEMISYKLYNSVVIPYMEKILAE